MSDKDTAADAGGMKKELTLFNFFTIGFGAIIGTGWVLLVGNWMVMGGGPFPAMIAFALGAVFLVPIGMVFGELTAAIPISGGIIEYVDRTYGRQLGFLTGWMLLLGNAPLCPWEAIAISTLLTDRFAKFPVLNWLTSVKLYTILGADVYLWPTAIALCAAVLVIFLNFKGAGAAAKLSSFLTKALLTGMVLAMVISFMTGSPSNALPVFSQVFDTAAGDTKATSLVGGIMAVLVMTPFFYAGFDTIPQQAEEASEDLDWKKFGIIPALALLASGGFYLVCIYAFGSIIDWHEFVVPAVPALAVLERINLFFYIAMLVIATLGPLGPMNAFFGASTRLMLALGRKRMLPEVFAEIDPVSGAPKTANVVLGALTLVGPFLGRNMLVPLTNVASLGFIFACTMAALACLRLRKTEPDLPRPYEVNGGVAGIGAAILAGLIIIGLMVLPFSPASLNMIEWTITLAWIAIGFAIFFACGGARAKA
ncbi:APC family permease [Olsenella urininfantis]|uniref:APC family permease n=1 Tax=Olsenella urininfantis TaxID=1871033 RepID=UPI000987610C|nr:APC family permease [Olsenella urininfantis]